MDVMIRWFCLLFGNQFAPDNVLDGYPVDRLMHDIMMALIFQEAVKKRPFFMDEKERLRKEQPLFLF